MTWLLRHNAAKVGVKIGADGYVAMPDLLAFLNGPKGAGLRGPKSVTSPWVRDIVAACPKQRFELSEDGSAVRATQGHSLAAVDPDLLLTRIESPDEVPLAVHGTYMRVWDSIRATGLNRGTRQHIHMAIDVPGADHVVSGARSSANLFIYVDVAKAMAAGIPFYRSKNNVILTSGVDGVLGPEFFQRVEHGGKVIFTGESLSRK